MLIKNIKNIPSFLAGDHTYIKEVLHPNNDNISIQYSLAHATLPIGETSLPHLLHGSEVYFITKGQGIVFINDEQKAVSVGDMVFIPPRAKQYIQNTGDEPLEFLCIVHPEWKAEEEELL
jgi:mannose-6-phosphate isomerase-like protein (cupin superfamily)